MTVGVGSDGDIGIGGRISRGVNVLGRVEEVGAKEGIGG